MIYNKSAVTDYNNILRYIDDFTTSVGVGDVQIETEDLAILCQEIRQDFPHTDGLLKASVFKKVANFVSHFMHYRPIRSVVPVIGDGDPSREDINAIVAFDIAIICLENSQIIKDGGASITVDQPIYISGHSFIDIIEALSATEISPKQHYQLLAVFFEQLVYKTNGHCEYKDVSKLQTPYSEPFNVTDGDDLAGA